MAKKSAIEWCDATWNPWMGCTKVSEGCKNCYMFRDQKRYGHDPTELRKSKTTFNDPLKWKEPKRIFVCSWSDFFHPQANEWRGDAYQIMRQAPHHTYLILTKRPEYLSAMLPLDWLCDDLSSFPNIWLGVSVEIQNYIYRMSTLYDIPASMKFLSAEPLLGPLDLSEHMGFVDWVITGGESGPNARPMDLDWARDIRDQCKDHGVAYFHKQHGGSKKINGAWGGRELDGKIWNEFPE